MNWHLDTSMNSVLRITFVTMLLVWLVTGSSLLAGADADGAVYEFRKWDCVLKSDKVILKGKWRVRILNKRGKDHAEIVFGESPFVRLKKIEVRRFGSDGAEEQCIKKKDLVKVCGYGAGGSVYNDDCYYSGELGSSRYPYTIEVEYEKEYKSLFFWSRAVFQRKVPVQRAEYCLTVDGDVPFRYRTIGSDLEPVVSTVDGKQQYVWALESIPALEEYDYLPSWENRPIQLEFAADEFSLGGFDCDGSSWNGLGRWYTQLSSDRMLLSDGTTQTIEPLNAREVVETIYRDVQESIRYVAIMIGVGGWQPHTAASTIDNGYGDCKDMSNLLTSRLRNAGIDACPVLIMTRGDGRTDSTFPTDNFNHVITMAVLGGTDTLWLDATCSDCPISSLRWDDGDVTVLAATDQGGKLVRTPVASYADNLTERISHWTLNEDLSADLECELTAHGSHGCRLRGLLSGKDKDEQSRLVSGLFRKSNKKYKITNYTITNADQIDEPLVITISGESVRPARKLRGAVYFDPLIMARLSRVEDTDLDDRPYALNKGYPYTVLDRVVVSWSEALQVDSIALPTSDSLAYSFGHLTVVSEHFPDSASISFCKAGYTYTIDTSAFTEFQQYQTDVRKTLNGRLKLYVP